MEYAKPLLTGGNHPLPFDALAPREFERLCLWLVRREGFDRAEHLGAAGGDQGRDIVAWRDDCRWVFQCKRVRRFGPTAAQNEFDKLIQLSDDEKPDSIAFVVACDVRAKTRREIRKRCERLHASCEFWTGTELDERVRRHRDIVEEFFQLGGSPLLASRPKKARLSNVPSLPKNFLPRDEHVSELKERLLKGCGAVGVTGAGTVGVQGMGGIGKSVIAAAVAHDDEIQETFRDGIFWVSIGQEPGTLAPQLSQIAEVLSGRREGFENEQQGKAVLEDLMRNRSTLLILDDAWNPRHAEPFDVVGESGRLLLTTRDKAVLTAIGAEEHSIDVLTKTQALTLLASWSGTEAVDDLPEEATKIAHECGYLPLALAMVGAMVEKRPETWKKALRRLRSADLAKIETRFSGYPYPNLLRALAVSVDALDDSLKARYLDFAVFAQDTLIPEATLQVLWGEEGLDEDDVDDVLGALSERSLCRRRDSGFVTLHDLQSDYIRAQAAELEDLHERLVSAYRVKSGGAWHEGPNDGYFYQYLPTHLAASGRREELRDLLRNPLWVKAKLDATGCPGLVADYESYAGDKTSNLVGEALKLAAHTLTHNSMLLPTEFWGRLGGVKGQEIQRFLTQLGDSTLVPWLRPIKAGLTSPGGPLVRTLAGHTDAVRSVAVTPDGKFVVSGSEDHTLGVWQLETGEKVCTLKAHTKQINSVAVTPDGKRVVSASDDKTIKVWTLSTGEEFHTLRSSGHDEHLAVSVTPDGEHAISLSVNHDERIHTNLVLWSLTSCGEVRSIPAHQDWGWGVAVTLDGKRVISASDDHTLNVWNLKSGRRERTLTGHSSWVWGVAATQQHVVSASLDNTLIVWSLRTGKAVRVLKGHAGQVRAVAVTPDGKQAVSASDDGTLKVWSLASGRVMRNLKGHAGGVWDVAVTPDGKQAVSASDDGTLKVWSLEPGTTGRRPQRHAEGVLKVAVTPNGERVVSASFDKTLKLWCLASGELIRTLKGHADAVWSVAVTPDSNRAVSLSEDGTLKLWDLQTGEEIREFEYPLTNAWDEEDDEYRPERVYDIVLTKSGKRVISCSLDGGLNVWDLKTGEKTRTLDPRYCFPDEDMEDLGFQWPSTTAVSMTPCGKYVVSASDDSTVRIWNLKSGRTAKLLDGHTSGVGDVSVTPDGKRVISASADHTLKVWSFASGRVVRTLTGHSAGVRCVAVSPSGRYAASGSENTLKVWNLKTGSAVASFQAEARISCCAWSERVLVIGDSYGHVHFLKPENLADYH